MKNVSIINSRNNCSRTHMKKQIFRYFVKTACCFFIVSPFLNVCKLTMATFHLSETYYSSKSVEYFCKSIDKLDMFLFLLVMCFAFFVLCIFFNEEDGK